MKDLAAIIEESNEAAVKPWDSALECLRQIEQPYTDEDYRCAGLVFGLLSVVYAVEHSE